MRAESAKVLLSQSNQRLYREFILNDDKQLCLPEISFVPWIGASKRQDTYRKKYSHEKAHHIKFITKNEQPYTFVWQTDSARLKEAMRWGIVHTHSLTSSVIASLGQYRITAHERVLKGFVSNSQAVKLKLLDLYQDRFTLLHAIESLVNKNCTHEEYIKVFNNYIEQLATIAKNSAQYFSEIDCPGLNEQSISEQIILDIHDDIHRAKTYLSSLEQQQDLRSYSRARGTNSILEFVKRQMIHGLYEFQGLNQDMTYSLNREFALTRGHLNDFIEDALKEIDDHEADMRNAVTDAHHGIYATEDTQLLTYDFSRDHLSPARERQVLMAISFIEGWDVVENKKDKTACVKTPINNQIQQEELELYAATRWRIHRSVAGAIRSFNAFLLNIIKGFFVSTRPLEEENWNDEDFHLQSIKLRAYLKPTEPLWKKPFAFFKQIRYAIVDILYGIRDFGTQLIIKMPDDIVNDWRATQDIPSLDEVLALAIKEINDMNTLEEKRFLDILEQCPPLMRSSNSKATSRLVEIEYELSKGEFNDLLNSVVRGVAGFSKVFTHDIYAKDPIGGLVFSTAYFAGVGMIYLPATSASIFGSTIVNAFSKLSYAMAHSSFGAATAGSSTIAEISSVIWDGINHGPSGIAMNTLHQFGEDPLTFSAYGLAAYGLGNVLVNGIAGHAIPWLSHALQEDLGTDPSTGYPLIGAKFAIMLYELLMSHAEPEYKQVEITEQLVTPIKQISLEHQKKLERFKLLSWLVSHTKSLPKLESEQQFVLAHHIERLFTKEESVSLKRLIYPVQHPSIAFQIFAIPLAYIPAVLRCVFSPCLSLIALIKNKPYPFEPMRRAAESLLDKTKKDLSRLLVLATNLTHLIYIWLAAFVKMFAYIGVMGIGRIAAWSESKPAHSIHRFFAWVHTSLRSFGEYLYPARALKSVAVSHPTDIIIKENSSYRTFLCHLMKLESVKEEQIEPALNFGCPIGGDDRHSGSKTELESKVISPILGRDI